MQARENPPGLAAAGMGLVFKACAEDQDKNPDQNQDHTDADFRYEVKIIVVGMIKHGAQARGLVFGKGCGIGARAGAGQQVVVDEVQGAGPGCDPPPMFRAGSCSVKVMIRSTTGVAARITRVHRMARTVREYPEDWVMFFSRRSLKK